MYNPNFCFCKGNGHERDFLGDERVFILDMYNRLIYPGDNHAKHAIRRKIELNHHTKDQVYLEHIRRCAMVYSGYIAVCVHYGP